MSLPKKIVLVCSGNTCRSAMAEAVMRKALADEFGGATEGVSVVSAGIQAREGDPASENAVAAMKEIGLDVGAHRARPLTADVLEGADLVLTMTTRHKQEVLSRHPGLHAEVMTLNEFAGLSGEIGPDTPDPFGGPLDVYRETAKHIGLAVARVVERIRGRHSIGPQGGSRACENRNRQ